LWWLLGQGEWDQLPEKVRRAIGRQILLAHLAGDATGTIWDVSIAPVRT
jgi:hypothetical protein